MSESSDVAVLKTWLAMPMESSVKEVIERVRRTDDVVHVAVMPDVHLAGDVCVGTVMATRQLIYPSAVGGDIGCGMLAIGFNAPAEVLKDSAVAGTVLRRLGEMIPPQRRHRTRTLTFPAALKSGDLSCASLQSLADDDGKLQFGTLGSGNHFVELQADENDQLWLMIHSGSRAIGQAVKSHHLAGATIRSCGMLALDSDSTEGQAYLQDHEWARRFAGANREAMMRLVIDILRNVLRIEPDESTLIACDHNHVGREEHSGQSLLVHRKGAMGADAEVPGIVPGSMGTRSFHVEGRGCAESLRSSAHGAGRLFSRHGARERFNGTDLRRQMQGVWFDPRLADAMREESPGSYKDIQSVMRAQRDLVKITRELWPLLVYKGR